MSPRTSRLSPEGGPLCCAGIQHGGTKGFPKALEDYSPAPTAAGPLEGLGSFLPLQRHHLWSVRILSPELILRREDEDHTKVDKDSVVRKGELHLSSLFFGINLKMFHTLNTAFLKERESWWLRKEVKDKAWRRVVFSKHRKHEEGDRWRRQKRHGRRGIWWSGHEGGGWGQTSGKREREQKGSLGHALLLHSIP